MKCSSLIAALVLVCMVVPAGFHAGGSAAATGARSDPAIVPEDNHNETANWDFSVGWAYCATAVDLSPGKANVSMTNKMGADKWAKLASLGAGAQREDFSAAYDDVDGMVIVHGGRYYTNGMQDTDWYRPLMTYDPASDKWTDRGESKLPAGNVGVWDGPDGAFLTHGGYYTWYDMMHGVNVYEVNRSTFAWLPATQTWSQRADGPALYHHAAVYDPIDGLMITMGGMDTVVQYNSTQDYYYNYLYTYNYTNDLWSQRNATGTLPPARAYHSAVWDNESGQMIIFGGYNGQAALQDCWAYNYTQNRWTQLTSATPSRYMHAAAWDPVRAVMIICAGRAGALNTNDTQIFDPSANTWSWSTKLSGNSRVLVAGAFDTQNGRMVVCGGGDGTGQNQLQDAWALHRGEPAAEYLEYGTVQSSVLDLGPAFQSINKVSWDGDMPVGTSVSLHFRASNLNVNATAFTETANASKPTQQGRYLQWNISLQSSADRELTPELWAVHVEYTLNNKPVANATGPGLAFKRTSVRLDGTATDADGDALAYKWTKLSGPPVTINTHDLPSASFMPNASGTYVFTLVASDPFADSPASTVTVTVNNRRPRAEAGPDQTGYKGALVTLNGLGIDDDKDPLTYEWTQTGGPNITLVQPTLRNLSFVPTKIGNYTFRLTVDDGEETSAPAIANATITGQAPSALLAASPAMTFLNETVDFSAPGSSDPDGKLIAYMFDFGDGNRTNWQSGGTANHSYARPGTFNATVTVRDDDGFISESSPGMKITVQNRPPVVDASVTPEAGNTSTLFRFLVPKGSTYDPDGAIASYFWDFGDGTNASSSTAVHTYKQKGTFEVRFRVTDNWGAFTEQFINISVANRAPEVAAAAPSQTLTLNTGLEQLFLADVTDPDGDALTYTWNVNGVQQAENGSKLFFKPDKTGAYHITLTISDGETSTQHAWDVTAKKKPAVVEEVNTMQYAIPAGIIIIVAVVAGAVYVIRRARPKDEPVVVYAPPGYKPGDELAVTAAGAGPSAPATSSSAAYSTPAPSSTGYAPQPSAVDDSSAEIATIVATAPSAGGPAPMEAIPYAEPIAPSEGGSAMEAEPVTESETAAPPAAARTPPATRRAQAHSRPPTSYQPPPKSGMSPMDSYTEQMWRKRYG
jgi:hypothetical protein